jgi:hypothetical protein
MGGTLLVALSALIAAVVGAALIGSTTDSALSPCPGSHGRDHATSLEHGGNPDPDWDRRPAEVASAPSPAAARQVRPGTGTTPPVVTLLSGDARKTMVAAMSSGFGHAP